MASSLNSSEMDKVRKVLHLPPEATSKEVLLALETLSFREARSAEMLRDAEEAAYRRLRTRMRSLEDSVRTQKRLLQEAQAEGFSRAQTERARAKKNLEFLMEQLRRYRQKYGPLPHTEEGTAHDEKRDT